VGSENRTPSDEREKNFERVWRLFQEHDVFIRSVIRFTLRNPSEVDDFFQELFLSLAMNPPPEELKSPRGYLYRYIMERSLDWCRAHARRKKRLRQVDLDADPQSDHKAAETIVSQSEEVRILFDRIQEHLSRNEARAILYRFKYDCTLEETAKTMGLKPRTVIRYVCTGLKKLRELVNKKESEEQP
jgi:RNA polymerase sigma factor (sigma-70 family)